MCPSGGNQYQNFENCDGEVFQIIGEGTSHNPIKSGQRIRLHYGNKVWVGCSFNNNCKKTTCPGKTAQGTNFTICEKEIFRIYARGRKNEDVIYNGDVVMLYYVHGGKYISIQGQNEGNDTSLNFCPGVAPPAYLSYGICSKNAFRVYRKP